MQEPRFALRLSCLFSVATSTLKDKAACFPPFRKLTHDDWCPGQDRRPESGKSWFTLQEILKLRCSILGQAFSRFRTCSLLVSQSLWDLHVYDEMHASEHLSQKCRQKKRNTKIETLNADGPQGAPTRQDPGHKYFGLGHRFPLLREEEETISCSNDEWVPVYYSYTSKQTTPNGLPLEASKTQGESRENVKRLTQTIPAGVPPPVCSSFQLSSSVW